MLSWETFVRCVNKIPSDHLSYPRHPFHPSCSVCKDNFWDTHNQSAHINHPFPLCFDFLFTQVLDSNKAFICMPSPCRVVYSESQHSSDKLWGFKITTDHLRCGHLCFASELEFLI